MMNVLWYYRPEHTEGGTLGGTIGEYRDNEVLAAKHRDETLVACIEDRGYVLTYNEYCRYDCSSSFNLSTCIFLYPGLKTVWYERHTVFRSVIPLFRQLVC